MTGIPVIIVSSGGLPVVSVSDKGAPAVEVTNFGIPVVIVAAGGIPMVFTGDNAENLVSNGEFDDATGWTLSSGWTISGGTLSCDGTDASTADISIPELVEGNQYRIQFDLSGSVTALSIRLGSAFTNLYTADASDGASGFVDEIVTATAGTTLRFRCNGANGFVGDIDNLVVTLAAAASVDWASGDWAANGDWA